MGHSLFLYVVSTSLCIPLLAKVLLRDRLRSTSGHCWPTSGEQRMLQSENRQTTMCQCQHVPAMKPIHTLMPTPALIAWIPFDAFNKLWALQTTSQKDGITSNCNQFSKGYMWLNPRKDIAHGEAVCVPEMLLAQTTPKLIRFEKIYHKTS